MVAISRHPSTPSPRSGRRRRDTDLRSRRSFRRPSLLKARSRVANLSPARLLSLLIASPPNTGPPQGCRVPPPVSPESRDSPGRMVAFLAQLERSRRLPASHASRGISFELKINTVQHRGWQRTDRITLVPFTTSRRSCLKDAVRSGDHLYRGCERERSNLLLGILMSFTFGFLRSRRNIPRSLSSL